MRKIGKVAAAYIMASTAAIPVGWVVALILDGIFIEPIPIWFIIAFTWLGVVGLPSLIASAQYLLKQLGVNNLFPVLSIGASRSIPVGIGTDLAQTVPSIFSPSSGPAAVTVDEVQIEVDNYVIPHRVLLNFLRTAWNRQKNHKDGLSRNFWVDQGKQLERQEYEAIIAVLERNGLIQGRKPGRSGKLLMPPLSTLEHLREQI